MSVRLSGELDHHGAKGLMDRLTCVAAPILRNGVAVAAVSISGPTSRMKKLKLSVISSRLKEVCREISQELA